MNYYIYQVFGQLKSECLKSSKTFEQVLDDLSGDAYGLRQVLFDEYRFEQVYNASPLNPWN